MTTKDLIPFKPGFDPRRNLRGVPKDAIAMRKMLRKIAAELVAIKDDEGKQVEVTRLYARARLAFSSRNYKEFEMVLKALYPELLRENVDLNVAGGMKVIIEYANSDDQTTEVAPCTTPGQTDPAEI